ncbi:Vacuolar protein sorting-associated protein 5 [Thoreauomyces humboldtii]|nr:Vacuolar protein sorting-associated protein 5 [Thoreauomyces humboldtii]
MGAYVVYRVKTQTDSPAFRSPDVAVNRRFNDFLWLFDKLVAQHPGIIVPPVPEKQTLGRFQEDFVESRRVGLESFLRKVVTHPSLQGDDDLRAFLESETFLADRKKQEAKGLFGVFGGSSAPSSAPTKNIDGDPDLEARRLRIETFEPQLRALSRALEDWQRFQADLSLATHEIATSLQHLANIDLTKPPSKKLTQLADIQRRITDIQERQAKHDIISLDSNTQYYVRVVNSVNLAFQSRARSYQTWQTCVAALQKKRDVLEKLHTASTTRSDKIAATITEIDEADLQSLLAAKAFKAVSANLRLELDRFDAAMNNDFSKSTKEFLNTFIQSQREITELWESYESTPPDE